MLAQKSYVQAMLAYPNENWTDLLQRLSQVADTEEMRKLCLNPFISTDTIESILLQVLPGLSVKQKNLTQLLVKHRRINLVGKILQSYDQMSLLAQGKYVANISTAQKVTLSQKKKIEKYTTQAFSKINNFVFRYTIDRALIGGFVVNIDNQIINASVRYRLETLMRDLGSL